MTHSDSVDVTPRLLAKILIVGLSILFALHVFALILYHGLGHDYAMGYVPLTHMDMEANIPTMASFMMMALCACALGLMASRETDNKRHKRAWALLAILFVLLAMDEVLMFHEQVASPLTHTVMQENAPRFAWIVAYGLLVAAVGAFFLKWFLELRRDLQISLFISGAIFLSGALGMEFAASKYVESLPAGYTDIRTLTFDLMATVEEMLEFSGLAYFLFTLVKELGGISIRTPRLAEHAGTRQ